MNQREEINFSPEALNKLLISENYDRIFVVTGGNSFEKCGAKTYIEESTSSCETLIFDDFANNPQLDDVKKGIELFEKFGADVIIAIGGGSSIDMAKLICYFSEFEVTELDSVLENYKREEKVKRCPLVAIPTTTGSGSEATHFAVVYHEKKKFSIADELILPDITILNFQFAKTAGRYLIAHTGLDALSQAIESYWSINSTLESQRYASESIKLILEFLPKAQEGHEVAFERMIIASNLAGKAINITKTTAPHAMSYVFTSHYGIPHGHAVALTIPSFLNYNFEISKADNLDKRGHLYVKQNLIQLSQLFGKDSVSECAEFLVNFITKLGLELNLSALGISRKDIDFLVDNINYERLKNNPRALSKNSAIGILIPLF